MPAMPAVGDPGTNTVAPPNDWASKVLANVAVSISPSTGSLVNPTIIGSGTKGTPGITMGAAPSPFGTVLDWATATGIRSGTTLSVAGTGVSASANEYAALIQAYAPSTSSAADYQKTGLFVQAWSDDPSTATLRAMVALDSRAYIGGSSTTGKVWAGFDLGEIKAGGDGTIFVREINIYNRGTDVSTVGAAKQKTAMLFIPRGSAPSTTVLQVANDADAMYFHHGFHMTAASLGTSDTVDSFLELAGKWVVRPSGKTVIGSTTALSATPLLEVQHPSAKDPLVHFGGTTNAPFTVYWQTSSSLVKMGMSNTTDQFITGTVQGDWFISPTTAGMSVHIGGTSSVIKVKQNNTLGFFNVTPVARPSAYTPTNVVTDRSYDANATTVDELADIVGTVIADLQAYGLLQ